MPKQGSQLSLKPVPNLFYGDVYLEYKPLLMLTCSYCYLLQLSV